MVRRLNQYVEEQAPWRIAKEEGAEAERRLDDVLYHLADGLRGVAVALASYLPETAPRILEALHQPADCRLGARARRRSGRGGGHRARGAALPAGRRAARGSVIDTHAHLDACADPPGEVVARAREAGVERILTVGTTVEGCRTALALADELEGVFAILGIHPHEAGSAGEHDVREVAELLGHPKAVGVGETGLDYYRDYAPPEAQRELFERLLAVAADAGKPVVIHTRAANEDTLEALRGFDGDVVLHCFSAPALLPEALERGWYVSFAGNVDLPEGDRPAARGDAGARRPAARRDRLAVPRAAAEARPPERARVRGAHARGARAGAPRGPGRARGPDRGERRRVLRPSVTHAARRRRSASTSSSTRTSSA